ncbi:MAG: BrnA antitoxin family protein [Azoarcus sp.]|jgi:uncharacterized protein (DUF4415 family)|nr:BrnA antitoxin family protein [Azoarcus sp.]
MSDTFFETRDGRRLRLNSEEKDARIHAAAMADPDASVLTDEEWERVLPKVRIGRPPSNTPLKVPVTMRLDADVADYFKASGRGWQTRINEILRAWSQSHELTAP